MNDVSAVARGRRAEALAEAFLVGQGFAIETRNFRCPYGEIDLIAREGEIVCFVEVRARQRATPVAPLETLTARKIGRLITTARAYLVRLPEPWPLLRFDALGILLVEPPEFTLVRDAFEVSR